MSILFRFADDSMYTKEFNQLTNPNQPNLQAYTTRVTESRQHEVTLEEHFVFIHKKNKSGGTFTRIFMLKQRVQFYSVTS